MHQSMSIAVKRFYFTSARWMFRRGRKIKECRSILLLIEGEMAIPLRLQFVLFTPSHPSHKCCDQVKSKVTGSMMYNYLGDWLWCTLGGPRSSECFRECTQKNGGRLRAKYLCESVKLAVRHLKRTPKIKKKRTPPKQDCPWLTACLPWWTLFRL
jgi:hypothetical protein